MSVAERFYDAFALGDFHTMGLIYAPHASFSDPVFPLLGTDEVRAMWKMLLSRAQDFSLNYNVQHEDGNSARVVWVARYTFSATGRPVTNRILTEMNFAAGRIVRQVDRFGFWQWSRQALGMRGLLLGWTPLVRDKVRAQAAIGLRSFMQQERQRGR